MYTSYFNLTEAPFSITPDPRYLYMSKRHREALAHLLYGIQQGGGFVQLTGEVGTGKTTLCRCMMLNLPGSVDAALILNPRISEKELLSTICDELHIEYPAFGSVKVLLDRLNQHLLQAHARGRRTVLLIDEAQNLTMRVLEQVRLLTNLETEKHKLLQIILVGQTELVHVLDQPMMRQLAQRITARYHLLPLSVEDTMGYVAHRMRVAGSYRPVFTRSAVRKVAKFSQGVPRLINAVCDRSLLGAYSSDESVVTPQIVAAAAKEVRGMRKVPWYRRPLFFGATGLALFLIGAMVHHHTRTTDRPSPASVRQTKSDKMATVQKERHMLGEEVGHGAFERSPRRVS